MQARIDTLDQFLDATSSLAVLTGAGVSTASGIPDYRDDDGNWKHARPIQFAEFSTSRRTRQRYWARSFIGWQRFSRARPNTAHAALAALEHAGKVETLITQNVDGLHDAAGSRRVIDLHGDLGRVCCLDCSAQRSREDYQRAMREANPDWHAAVFRHKPDGDAELAEDASLDFSVVPCERCGGVVKPDVVMFGESVPRERVEDAMAAVERADAMLVVGSSLMLYSGFRFARQAHEQGKPFAILNRGKSRADGLAALKIEADCGPALAAGIQSLTGGAASTNVRRFRPAQDDRESF
jgi:NAD-dependent SIR2 family protein deacetylase